MVVNIKISNKSAQKKLGHSNKYMSKQSFE